VKYIIAVAVVFFLLLCCYEEHAIALNADHTIHLACKDSHISLAADGTSLLSIIETISAETGIAIKITGDLPVNPVTTNFTDLTIEEALQRLLYVNAQNYIMFLDTPKSISLILVAGENNSGKIFGKKISGRGGASEPYANSIEKGDAALSGTEGTDDTGYEVENEYYAELPTIMEALKANDPQARVKALSFLHENVIVDEKTAHSIFEAALADGDASVRGYAVQVLATREEPDAMRK
jgi:hypothetical protein